jgi:hypothetical protein
MLNSDFLHTQSEEFAKRLRSEIPSGLDEQIQRAYQLALARTPTVQENARARGLIDQLQSKHGLSPEKSLAFFCLFIYNLNEFSYVD